VIIVLCAIAVAVSIRRLIALAGAPTSRASELASLDAFFAAKPELTRAHVLAGLVCVLAIPVQLSTRIRARYPHVHRRLGRFLMLVGMLVGISAYAMVQVPVGGWVEMSAIIVYATAFLAALLTAWWHIRHHDIARHREWMLRALAILLGIATTRPVMGFFFATRTLTHLALEQFFGLAFWIGFTSTVIAAEWYIRGTRPTPRASRVWRSRESLHRAPGSRGACCRP
jgi:hypothetical protein